jgi:hypothetical protein
MQPTRCPVIVASTIAPRTGIVSSPNWFAHVVACEPYASARRMFRVVDDGSSHAGQAPIGRMNITQHNLLDRIGPTEQTTTPAAAARPPTNQRTRPSMRATPTSDASTADRATRTRSYKQRSRGDIRARTARRRPGSPTHPMLQLRGHDVRAPAREAGSSRGPGLRHRPSHGRWRVPVGTPDLRARVGRAARGPLRRWRPAGRRRTRSRPRLRRAGVRPA